jgi:triacylglycerol lipase
MVRLVGDKVTTDSTHEKVIIWRGCKMNLIAAIMVLVCTVSLLTYAFFWVEIAGSSYRMRLREISRDHVGRMLLGAILSSAASLLLVVICFPLQYWKGLWRPSPQPKREGLPVFLVHGLYHNASAWVLYRWWLKRAGYTNTYCWSYSSFGPSFEQIRKDFHEWVDEIMDQHHPGQQAIMMGHSLGGLIIRAYLADSDPAQRVTAAVTLGTPHQGSKLAALGFSRLARSLIYRGTLIQELEQGVLPEEVRRLAVLTPTDNMVIPPAALSSAQDGWQYLETSPISHVALLYHWPTAKKVLEYLKTITGSQ